MDRLKIIEKTVSIINLLPAQKAEEISTFAAFLLHQYEEKLINDGMAELVNDSKSYDFLREEDVNYSVSDIKTNYKNEKG